MSELTSRTVAVDIFCEKTCRVCAKVFNEKFPMIKIYDDVKIEVNEGCTFKVAYELNLLNIKIDENDGLPQEACIGCVKEISKIFTFRKLCESSQIKLRQIHDPLKTVDLTDVLKLDDEDKNFIQFNQNCTSPPPSIREKNTTTTDISNVQLSSSIVQNPQPTTSRNALNEVILFDCSNTSQFISEKDDYSTSNNEEIVMDVDIVSNCGADDYIKEETTILKKKGFCSDKKPKYIRNSKICKPNKKKKLRKPPNIFYEINKNNAVTMPYITEENLKSLQKKINTVIKSDTSLLSESGKLNIYTKQSKLKKEIDNDLIVKKDRLKSPSDENRTFKENDNSNQSVEAKDDVKIEKDICKEKILPCSNCNKFKFFRRLRRDSCIHLKKQKISLLSDYCCYYCDENFENKQQVTNHIRDIHPLTKPFLCMDCNQLFDRHSNFILHSALNHMSENDLENLEKHNYDIIDKLNIQMCTECNKYKFESRIHIDRLYCTELKNNNELIESLQTDYCCYYCNENFNNFEILKEHVVSTHLFKKPFNCSNCTEKFMYYKERKYHHDLIHSNQKQIQCSICEMNYTSNSDFVEHVKTHIGDKNLVQKREIILCNICNKYKLLTRFTKDRVRCDRFEKEYRVPLSDKEYCCYYCNEVYDDKMKLHDHMLNGHSVENPFNCIECNGNFQSVHFRIKHYTQHHKNIDPYECPICDIKFKSRQKYNEHKNHYHTNKSYECSICLQKFYNTEALRQHKLKHETVATLKCKYCDRLFKQQHHLRDHELVHLNERPYKCETCGKTFRVKCTYQVHLRLHTGENLSICEFCGKSFTANCLLNIHKKNAHNDGNMYMCEYCGENFKELHLLNHHKKSHGDGFENNIPKKDRLKALYKRKYLHDVSFKCPVCEKVFYTPLALQKHVKLHDKNRKFKCPECSYSYDHSWALIVHSRRAHPKEGIFSCHCGKTFSCSEERDVHKKIHSNITLKCSYCDKVFRSKITHKAHEREKHTGDTAFECLICGKKFLSNLALRKHTRGAHNVEENKKVEEQILAEVANQVLKDV